MANTSALQVLFEPTVVTSLSGVTLRGKSTTTPVNVTFQPTVVTSLSGVTLRDAPLVAPNVVSTTPVNVTFAQAGTTIVPIVDADTSSQSVLGLGSGSVADNDLILWHTVSGDSSNLTINPNGTWQFSTAPSEDVVIGLMVYSQQNGATGSAGQIVFDTNGHTAVLTDVILRAPSLEVLTLPTDLRRNSTASITLDNVSVTPGFANTRIFLGDETGPELTSFSVVQNSASRYTINVTPDLVAAYGDYPLLIVIDKQGVTTAPVHYQPPIGWGYVDVTVPVTDQAWSVFYNHTGDAPIDGQLEWYATTSEPGTTVRVQGDGSVLFTHTDTNDTSDVVIDDRFVLEVRHIDSALNVGDWGTFTYLSVSFITAQFESTWDSFMYVRNDFDDAWDVYNGVDQTVDCTWDVYNGVVTQATSDWDISQYVRQDFASSWLFSGAVRAEFVSQWDTAQSRGAQVQRQFQSRWNVEASTGPLTVAFDSSWGIENILITTYPSRWNISSGIVGTDVGDDLKHRMLIVGEDRVMRIG